MCQMRFCRSFDTKAGEWHDVQLPFEEFIPLFRAKTVKDGAKLDPSTVTSIQVCFSTLCWRCSIFANLYHYMYHAMPHCIAQP